MASTGSKKDDTKSSTVPQHIWVDNFYLYQATHIDTYLFGVGLYRFSVDITKARYVSVIIQYIYNKIDAPCRTKVQLCRPRRGAFKLQHFYWKEVTASWACVLLYTPMDFVNPAFLLTYDSSWLNRRSDFAGGKIFPTFDHQRRC